MTTLPVGKKDNFNFKTVKRGDMLKLVTGETVIFEEMKRTRFRATYNKRGLNVPVYRDRSATIPFVLEILGHNAAAVPKPVKPGSLVPGALFIIEGKGKVYMFNKETASHYHGWDIATKASWRIPKSTPVVRIRLEQMFKELHG